jgi:hypothetical protein
MVDDLYDAISMVWSWRRPTSEGKATAVAIEPIGHQSAMTDLIGVNPFGNLHFSRRREWWLHGTNSTFTSC